MSIWKAASTVVVIAALILFLVVLGPLITIWSLNTLFDTGIPFTLWTWLAVFWLNLVWLSTVGSRISR
jgi:hypothetical protein